MILAQKKAPCRLRPNKIHMNNSMKTQKDQSFKKIMIKLQSYDEKMMKRPVLLKKKVLYHAWLNMPCHDH